MTTLQNLCKTWSLPQITWRVLPAISRPSMSLYVHKGLASLSSLRVCGAWATYENAGSCCARTQAKPVKVIRDTPNAHMQTQTLCSTVYAIHTSPVGLPRHYALQRAGRCQRLPATPGSYVVLFWGGIQPQDEAPARAPDAPAPGASPIITRRRIDSHAHK